METGVDVGGTFTDVVAWDGRRLATGKVPTTRDQADGVLEGIVSVAGSGGSLRHGTTAATNALLERRGATTALITDLGFEDLVEIGRQDRPSLYDTTRVRAAPPAGRALRFGAVRRDEAGSRIDGERLETLARRIAAAGVEAVAVSLLFSFVDGSAERAVAEVLRSALPEVAICLSSKVAPEFREYERTSTTLLNAYLMPEVTRYLTSLRRRSGEAGVDGTVAVMRSSGGLIPLDEAAELPAAILLSGPAGGVVAAAELGRALGIDRLVSFDMGGTSTDVCRIDAGRPDVAYERSIDGLPCRMPSVAVHTVGAGGGSVGWVDAGGALRVGPHSTGADPGPACYGRDGHRAAVTDANLALGRLDRELSGGLALDEAAAHGALRRLGDEAGMDVEAVALGMLTVVEEHMHRAIRAVSVEQGADPRSAHLVAFGGAGGLHATALARRLDMAGVLVPAHAGVFSALGLLLAPPRSDAARTVLLSASAASRLDEAIGGVAAAARAALRRSGHSAIEVVTLADVRYLGQSHETTVPYVPGEGSAKLAARFHAAHRDRNGFARPIDPIEIVTVRAEAAGRPALRWTDLPPFEPVGEPGRGSRAMRVPEGVVDAPVWWRPALAVGAEVVGPAVVAEPEATTVLLPGERAIVGESGALEVSW